MRLDHLFLMFVLLPGMPFGRSQAAMAAEKETSKEPIKQNISVQWYEPKVQATEVKGLTYVSLVGLTEPNVTVQVNPQSIIVIQPADANNKETPRMSETTVKSEARGFFRLRLWMPDGLSQVPISFKKDTGEQHSVLLTMRVDPKDVSLNVKVIRPTKTKIIKVMEKQPVRYTVGIGVAPMNYTEKLSPTGLADLKLQQTSAEVLRLEAAVKSTKWWWLMHYEMANFKTPSSLDDKTVKTGNSNLQAILLGARYRLNNASNELWALIDVDGRFYPMPAISSANEVSLIDNKIFRLGFGLLYLIRSENFDYSTSLFYREPVSIKVGSGELTYASKYTAGLQARVNYRLNEKWLVGTAAEFEISSFNYEYLNSPSLISNKGTGSSSVYQLMVSLQYQFGSEKAKDASPAKTP